MPDEANRQLHFHVGTEAHRATTRRPATRSAGRPRSEALDAEDIRLLYVAATRARDHLIVPDLKPDPDGGSLAAALGTAPARPTATHGEVSDGVLILDSDELDLPEPIEERSPAPPAGGQSRRRERSGNSGRRGARVR